MTTQQGKIVIKDINLGGISDSRYSGTEGSVAELFGLDIHSEPGVIRSQYDTKNDLVSGDAINQSIIAIIPTGGGEAYMIGTSTIWKRTAANVYSKVGDIPSGSAYGVIKDAEIFNGDIYYSMQERVGKYTPGDAWVDRDDDFRTISFDNFHPMIVIENDLYVGYTNHVGKIEPGATTGDPMEEVLLFPDNYIVESLGDRRNNLVIGTRKQKIGGTDITGFSRIYEWNLRSDSWDREQEIPEEGISAFLDLNGSMLFNAGTKGMLYSWDGSTAQPFKRIPGDWSYGNDARIYKRSSTTLDNRLMFGLITEDGLPVLSAIYSLGGYDAKYPKVFNIEYSSSATALQESQITSMGVVLGELLFGVEIGSSKSVRSIDFTSRKDGAYVVTRNIAVERDDLSAVKIRVCFRELNDQEPLIYVKKNNGALSSALATTKHENKGYIETTVEAKDIYSLQVKVEFPTSGTGCAEVENITLLI